MGKNIVLILFMGLITFACRYGFIALDTGKTMSMKWTKRLSYLPPAFLATMIAPSAVYTNSTTTFNILDNPYFYATIVTLIMTKFTKNFTVITIGGSIIFFVIRGIFSFLNI